MDGVSISECLTKNGGASIQSTLDTVSSWASMNLMKLNAKKCKELRVCFFKATPQERRVHGHESCNNAASEKFLCKIKLRLLYKETQL